jgi:hypothetical protein
VGSIFWEVLRLKIVFILRVIKWKRDKYLLYEVEVHVRIRRIEAGLSISYFLCLQISGVYYAVLTGSPQQRTYV